jgi:hypothetical protein
VAGSCEHDDDDPSGSGAMELVEVCNYISCYLFVGF